MPTQRGPPDFTSQMRIAVSSEPDAMRLPSGVQATQSTAPTCPLNGWRATPRATSQTRIVQSAEPEATSLPAGEKASDVSQSACPLNTTWADASCARLSRILTAPSSEPEARGDVPIVWREGNRANPIRADRGLVDALARPNVPYSNGSVVATRYQPFSVRGERDGAHTSLVRLPGRKAGASHMHIEQRDRLSQWPRFCCQVKMRRSESNPHAPYPEESASSVRFHVPHAASLIQRARHKGLAIRMEANHGHSIGVPVECAHHGRRCSDVPNAYRLVMGAGDNLLAIRREGHATDSIGMADEGWTYRLSS